MQYHIFIQNNSSFYLSFFNRNTFLWWNSSFNYEYFNGTKRIFKLFDKEIDLLTNPEEDYEVSKKKESDSSKEGKEDNDEVKDTL